MMPVTLRLNIVRMSSSVTKAGKSGFAFGAAIKADVTEGGGAWPTKRDDPLYSTNGSPKIWIAQPVEISIKRVTIQPQIHTDERR